MKKFILKVKKATKDFFTNKVAFSLVELIVVIAIMAVMAAVLAPALLGYVEKSRAQKDNSALDEVTNSMQLALADADIYDELVNFAVEDNYSCYCDGNSTTNTNANRIITKSPNLWLFNDNARLLDETVYKPAGKMRGVTVTFKPNGKSKYILKDGIVNQIGNDSTKKGSDAGKTLADANFERLYNRVRSTVGDTIKVNSQTYRNSDYTIFISMGSTGGNQSDKQDAIKVYGQYNGTNLPEVANASNIDSESQGIPRNDIVPENCTYTKKDGTVIPANGNIPSTPATGDTYEEGDYIYTYNKGGEYGTKWSVAINTKVTDKNKSSYGEILSEVAGQPITSLYNTFRDCTKLTTAPAIPNSVTNVQRTFSGCRKLTTAPIIPNSVTDMSYTFYDCKSLTTAPAIPNSVTNMYGTFRGCTQLTTAPAIPNSVTNMQDTFADCTSLATPPDMSDATRVTNMRYTFGDCYALTTAPAIPSSVTNMQSTFGDCTNLTTPPDMSKANSVTNMQSTFQSCTSLTTAPVIPNSVTDMYQTFWGCTSLTTAPAIPNSVTNMRGTFYNCRSLTTAPDMSNATSVTYMGYTLQNCISLTTAPTIPNRVNNMEGAFMGCTSLTTPPDMSNANSVKNMDGTFQGCTSLTTAPVIPNGVTNMQKTFYYCPSLTGTIEVNANPTSYNSCFKGTVKPITLTGSSTKKSQLASTANKNNITVQ